MYRRILVPYDGSPFSERAVDHASYLAKISGADLLLVNVTVLPALVYTYHQAANAAINEAAQSLMQSSKDTVVKTLDVIIDRTKKEGIRASYRHAVGDPAEVILEIAEEEKAGLIVMGSKGLHGLSKIKALGSVTRKVAENARCPIMIVH
jgi:nucleotide-binding universal stress UspA family protein